MPCCLCGENPTIRAPYFYGRLCPHYFLCRGCRNPIDNMQNPVPYATEGIVCPDCGSTDVDTRSQVDTIRARKNHISYKRYPGWDEEDETKEWEKWVSEHPEDDF